MIEVEVGDTIVEFPDGTAPDVMRNALRKQFGGPAATVANETPVARPAAEGGFLSNFMSGLRQSAPSALSQAEGAVPAGEQRTTTDIEAYNGKYLGPATVDEEGNFLLKTPDGGTAPVDAKTHVVLQDPRDRQYKVFARSEATNVNPALSVSSVLAPGLATGPLARTPGAVRAAVPAVEAATEAGPGTRQAVLEAGARRGIEVPRFYGSDNPVTQMTGMGLSNFPVLGTPAIRSTEKLLADLGKGVSEVATAQGGASMEGAGSAAQRGILNWMGPKTREALDEAYGAAEKAIDPNIRHASPETGALLDELTAARTNAGLPIPADLQSIARAIKGPIPEADDTYALLVKQLGEEGAGKVAKRMGIEATPPPSGLNFEGAKTLRTHVRQLQGSQRQNVMPGDLIDTELKRLEGALGGDLRSIVEQAGSKTGSALFERANTLAAKVAEDRSVLADIVGLKGDAAPAQVFDRLKAAAGSKSRADTEKLLRAKNAIGQDWDQVVSGITAQLGKDNKGDFSALNFVRDYNQLSDNGKAVLYGSKGAHRQALDDINELSRRFNKVQKFQNFSGTARSGAVIGAFATPIVALGKMFDPSILAGAALTRFTARQLSKPIDLSLVLSKPTTAAAAANWARAYERAQISGSPAGLANLAQQARNLANNINSEFDTKVTPDDLMPRK